MRTRAATTLIALLALFVLPPYLSLFADSESSLPPCCRRNGNHHCALRMMQDLARQGTAFRTVICRFPFQKATAAGCRLSVFPAMSATVSVARASHTVVRPREVVSASISSEGNQQKRAPPFLQNC